MRRNRFSSSLKKTVLAQAALGGQDLCPARCLSSVCWGLALRLSDLPQAEGPPGPGPWEEACCGRSCQRADRWPVWPWLFSCCELPSPRHQRAFVLLALLFAGAPSVGGASVEHPRQFEAHFRLPLPGQAQPVPGKPVLSADKGRVLSCRGCRELFSHEREQEAVCAGRPRGPLQLGDLLSLQPTRTSWGPWAARAWRRKPAPCGWRRTVSTLP